MNASEPRIGDYIEPGVRIVEIYENNYATAYDEPEEEYANRRNGARAFYEGAEDDRPETPEVKGGNLDGKPFRRDKIVSKKMIHPELQKRYDRPMFVSPHRRVLDKLLIERGVK